MIVEFIILVTSVVFTFIEIWFKDQFVSPTSWIVGFGSFVFGLTVSAMIPGIFYKGGEGYNLVLDRFTKKEKAFGWFLLELLIGFGIVAGLLWTSNYLFKTFYNYVYLMIIEWLLLVYIWFSNRSKYKFPWFYTVVTNIILVGCGYIIYALY